jgi:hypothetical protein
MKLFTFQWAGQFPSVLGIKKINRFKSQFGRDTSFN